MKRVLISGGAGFIGSSLALDLLNKGFSVSILDNLSPQIHGEDPYKSFLFTRIKQHVDFKKGDVRNRSDWEKALKGCDIVVHLAAETGTGQSMYQICHYTDVNIGGTAILMEILAKKRHSIERLVVASSRAVYGEGKYKCIDHGDVYPTSRDEKDMLSLHFEPRCPKCRAFVEMAMTDEESLLNPTSLYGITKLTQEQIILAIGAALGIPSIALRFQNVYGPGQSLHNPYTGILAIFTTLLRSNKKINVFEDGKESRDFVYIDDVISSIILAINSTEALGKVFNVGTGEPINVITTANYLKKLIGGKSEIVISGNFRLGDIRHSAADISYAKKILGFEANIAFEEGIKRYVDWVLTQEIPKSTYDESLEEMYRKGLFK